MIEHFVAGTTARTAAKFVTVNRKTAQRFFIKLRQIITENEEKLIKFEGEIEADESHFGEKEKENVVGELLVKFPFLAC